LAFVKVFSAFFVDFSSIFSLFQNTAKDDATAGIALT